MRSSPGILQCLPPHRKERDEPSLRLPSWTWLAIALTIALAIAIALILP